MYGISEINITDGDVNMLIMNHHSIAHIIGGQFTDGFSIADNAKIHIYGYGFNFDRSVFTGYWADGTTFYTYIAESQRQNIVLHEIPEPTVIIMLSIGSVFIRNRKYRLNN